MLQLSRRLVAIVVTLLAGSAFAAEARKPLTVHDRMREAVEFNRRTMIDPYKEVGRRDARWDDDVIKFLDLVALYWVHSSQDRMYRKPDPSAAEAIAAGEAAIGKGCDDPLVQYLYGRMLEENNQLQRGGEMIRKSYQGLVTSKYPPKRIGAAAQNMRRLEPKSPDREKLDKLIADNLAAECRGPFVNLTHQSQVLGDVQRELNFLSPKASEALYQRLTTQEGSDPWIVGMLAGTYHVNQAWAARGFGWANAVKPEGWKGFEEHLKLAEESLMKAIRAQPNLPEAPTLMITVSMGKSDGRHRSWFDRAIAVQMDYEDAYNKVFDALMPRWGGSHVEMLEVGIQAAQTQRYDTNAPFQFISAVRKVSRDSQRPGGKWDVWANPETYQMVSDVCTRYAETITPAQGSGWYRTFLAAIAWRIGKHQDARKQLDLAGENIELAAFGDLDAPGDLAYSQIHGLTGPQAADYQKAVELHDQGKLKEAVTQFKAIADKLPADDKGQLYLKDRIALVDNVERFRGGEWVDLMPATGRLTGWRRDSGHWRLEDNKIVGYSDQRGLALLYEADFGRRYEIMAEVEILTPKEMKWANGGVLLGFVSWQDYYGVFPDISLPMVGVTIRAKPHGSDRFEVEQINKLHVTLWDAKLTASVNGKAVPIAGPVPRQFERTSTVGVGSYLFQHPGQAIRVHAFKIRKLANEPAAKEQ